MRFITNSEQETKALGEALAMELKQGDLLLLYGPMGAGKSAFVRGVAKGLGIQGPIPSPTFTILQAYTEGRLPLYHFDWYRMADASELFEMGMEEYLQGDGVALVEWPQQALEALPAAYLQITLTPGDEETQRVITFTPIGGFRTLSFSEVH